jgi:hypothetical protein
MVVICFKWQLKNWFLISFVFLIFPFELVLDINDFRFLLLILLCRPHPIAVPLLIFVFVPGPRAARSVLCSVPIPARLIRSCSGALSPACLRSPRRLQSLAQEFAVQLIFSVQTHF